MALKSRPLALSHGHLELLEEFHRSGPTATLTSGSSVSIQNWLKPNFARRGGILSQSTSTQAYGLTIMYDSLVKHHVFVKLLKSRVFRPVLGIKSIKSLRQRPHSSLKRHQRHRVGREGPVNRLVGITVHIILSSAP